MAQDEVDIGIMLFQSETLQSQNPDEVLQQLEDGRNDSRSQANCLSISVKEMLLKRIRAYDWLCGGEVVPANAEYPLFDQFGFIMRKSEYNWNKIELKELLNTFYKH